jgi:hypothetical protein
MTNFEPDRPAEEHIWDMHRPKTCGRPRLKRLQEGATISFAPAKRPVLWRNLASQIEIDARASKPTVSNSSVRGEVGRQPSVIF